MEPSLKEIEHVYHAALERKHGKERSEFLDTTCGRDSAIRSQVGALLEAHEEAGDFLEAPILDPDCLLDDPPLAEGPGTIIDSYKLLELIGEGGFGAVYMAEQEEPIRRRVALKIIKLGMDTKQVIARFEAERQALAMMDHPNIARVLDAGATESGRPYFVMELVTGVSITTYCDANKLSTRQRLDLFVQVCNAVQHAHQKGIIHRDIKPSNVMVTLYDGKPVPKVIDFGVAKATNQRLTEKTLFTRYAHMIGTPAYMSPEQAEMSGLDIDTRSDIYSLGVLLYELLTGATPFCAEELRKAGYVEMQRIICEEQPAVPSTKLSTMGETLAKIAQDRKASPDGLRRLIRGDLDWIVMKSLDKDRTRRYTTPSEFATDVERHLNSEPVLAGPPAAMYRMKRFVQRRLALVTTTAAVTAAVVGGLIFSMVMYLQTDRALKREVVARGELQAVSDFLTNDLLASVYPENVESQEVTVRYILDAASENLSSKLRNSPLSEAAIRQTLGLTYQKMGDYRAAEPHMQRALEIHREQLGNEDPTTLASLDSLGWIYWYRGRDEQAAPLLVEALDTRQRVLGPEHPDTLESMTHLAWCDTRAARSAEGTVLAEKAYQIGCRVLGEDHPATLQAASCLAMKHVSGIRHAEAEAIAPHSYELSRRVLGEEHETTLVLMNSLVWLRDQQRRSDADVTTLAERAFEISQRVFGEAGLVTLHAMTNLGSLYTRQGRYEDAAPLLTRSTELARLHLGEAHAITICCGIKLGYWYRKQGQYDEHETIFLELLEISRQAHGERSALTNFVKFGLKARIKQLTELAKEQNASGDSEAEAATLTRLGEIRQAFEGPTEHIE